MYLFENFRKIQGTFGSFQSWSENLAYFDELIIPEKLVVVLWKNLKKNNQKSTIKGELQ